MENNIQTILALLVSAVLLFIFPVYFAYEKKDDLSYVMVLKYTQEFVDTTRKNGYFTEDEYDTFVKNIETTGNRYDITLKHSYHRKDPDQSTKGKYKSSIEMFETDYIKNILNKDKQYNMNVNDLFTVNVRNTNTTVATIMYNMVTLNRTAMNTRIYVSYGGIISNTKWFENAKYNVYEVEINKYLISQRDPVFTWDSSTMERKRNTNTTLYGYGGTKDMIYKTITYPITNDGNNNSLTDNGYVVDFNVEPLNYTKFPRLKGSVDSLEGYNVLLNIYQASSTSQPVICVGVNGIVVLAAKKSGSNFIYYEVVRYTGLIEKENSIKIVFKLESFSIKAAIFIDEKMVAYDSYTISESIFRISKDAVIPSNDSANTVRFDGTILNLTIKRTM